VTQALDEMAVGCVACLMMEADHSGSEYTLQQCVQHSTTVQEAGLDRFREVIRWQDNSLGAISPGFPLESPAQPHTTRNVSCRKSFLVI
jgi:hypothetical protein